MNAIAEARAAYEAEAKNVIAAEAALKEAAAAIGNVWAAFLTIEEMPEELVPYAATLEAARAKRDAHYAAIPSIWA